MAIMATWRLRNGGMTMGSLWLVLMVMVRVDAFSLPPRRPRSSSWPLHFGSDHGSGGDMMGGAGGGGGFPPAVDATLFSFFGGGDPNVLLSNLGARPLEEEEDHYRHHNKNDTILQTDARGRNETSSSSSSWRVRRGGGGRPVPQKPAPASVASVGTFWTRSFQAAASSLTQPFRAMRQKLAQLRTPQADRDAQALLEELQTMPVKRVTVPNSTVLPESVVHIAARRAGMIGSPLQAASVRTLAQSLKEWYQRQGFVLHTVEGATLDGDTATAEIQVVEPTVAHVPVQLHFVKEMIVDDETGLLLTFAQYKKKHATRRTFGFDATRITKADLNTTFVLTSGRTRPHKIAHAMALVPGQPFQWHMDRWARIAQSGIFAKVLQVEPQATKTGTVQLQVVVAEAPPRHLEYGLGKSLYTNSWEGELDLEHANLLGGGERLGLSVRRSRKEAKPSVRVHLSNDRFGMHRGYHAEVFGDFVTDEQAASKGVDDTANANAGGGGNVKETAAAVDLDSILDRKGATFRIRNPIPPHRLTHSVISTSAERTKARNGMQENIGSTKLTMGPVTQELPLGARSNFDVTLLAGTRLAPRTSLTAAVTKDNEDVNEDHCNDKNEAPVASGLRVRPFTSISATTRQLFPLSGYRGVQGQPILLAFRHSATTSAAIPWHEAKAQGQASDIRGSTPNGRVTSSIRGTTELRIPVTIPLVQDRIQQDAGVVVFGDWLFAREPQGASYFKKSSIGLGLRKTLQGIPLQFDVCYANDGKVRTAFGLGGDFTV